MKQAVISFNSSLYCKSTSLFTIVEKVKAKGKCEYLKNIKRQTARDSTKDGYSFTDIIY